MVTYSAWLLPLLHYNFGVARDLDDHVDYNLVVVVSELLL